MSQTSVSIVMPAYRAEAVIVGAVESVLAQTHADWQLIVVADDGTDYAAVLGRQGISDWRIRHLSSGGMGSGASKTRNAGLEAATTAYMAVLDADDRFKPAKLSAAVAALEAHALVSMAIDVTDPAGVSLRQVGAGPDGPLTAGTHKWRNLSMDSMIAWDRRRVDGRYDPGLPNMNDLDFLLRLFAGTATSFHIGAPLHDYVKQPASLSNGTGFTERMIAAKTTIRERLRSGHYGLADADVAGLDAFLEISLRAEHSYQAAAAARPGLLFEDHIEPLLRAASTSPALGTAG